VKKLLAPMNQCAISAGIHVLFVNLYKQVPTMPSIAPFIRFSKRSTRNSYSIAIKLLMVFLAAFTMTFLGALATMAMSAVSHAAIPDTERAVLQALFNSTNGNAWTDKTNWNGAPGTECTWARIACNADESHVTEIVLNNNNLVGTLPTTINQMSALRVFVVALNDLEGPIPALNTLTELRVFSASFNALSGSIPTLAGLIALREFNVGLNQLSGPIPSLNGLTALEFFSVGANPLPALTGLSSLQTFIVVNNQLTGSIPSLSGLTELRLFNVANNQLTGAVPAVPSPSALTPDISALCPNQLTVSPDADWDAATPGATWDVGCTATLPQQVLTFGAAPTLVVVGTGTVAATVTPSPGSTAPIVYSSATQSVCSVDTTSGLVTVLSAGVEGSICTIAADKANDATINSAVQVQQSIAIQGLTATFTVTPSTADANGFVQPNIPQTVTAGDTASFVITSNAGFNIASVGGTCGGTLFVIAYTTNAITADCTVIASFVAIGAVNFIVTPSTADTNGSINPNTAQTVASGNTTTFTVTPNTGFNIATVNGTCGGALTGNSFTTNPITADCTVIASFVAVSATTFTVTPNATDPNGAIAPNAPQTIASGDTTTFTITPNAGFFIAGVTGTCGGVLTGSRFTTNAISADCTVNPSFALIPVAAEGVAVPTLSQWTLMSLAAALLALALHAMALHARAGGRSRTRRGGSTQHP
jgi:Divergent InlB B-repeat domain